MNWFIIAYLGLVVIAFVAGMLIVFSPNWVHRERPRKPIVMKPPARFWLLFGRVDDVVLKSYRDKGLHVSYIYWVITRNSTRKIWVEKERVR